LSADPRQILRRARTAAGLPSRVTACEDRFETLEEGLGAQLDQIRGELASIRALIEDRFVAEAEATQLVGQLLQAATARLEALEQARTDAER